MRRRLLRAPRPRPQMLVCTAGCGTPLHPAAIAGTRFTTHPGCPTLRLVKP
jgi:hypothetical protein